MTDTRNPSKKNGDSDNLVEDIVQAGYTLADEWVSEHENDILSDSRYQEIRDSAVPAAVDGVIGNQLITADTVRKVAYAYMNEDRSNQRDSIIGIYTGAVLDRWAEQRHAASEDAQFMFDGGGNQINSLFSQTQEPDSVYVRNITGRGTLWGAAEDSAMDEVILENITGDSTGRVASNGEIDTVVLRGIDGDLNGPRLKRGGHIDSLVFVDVVGTWPATVDALEDGSIDLLVYHDVRHRPDGRSDNFTSVGSSGGIGTVVFSEVEEMEKYDHLLGGQCTTSEVTTVYVESTRMVSDGTELPAELKPVLDRLKDMSMENLDTVVRELKSAVEQVRAE